MKTVKIQILGRAGHGKSLFAYIIREALKARGIHGYSLDDDDTIPPLGKAVLDKLIEDNKDDFEVQIETIQVNRSFSNI